MRSNDERAALDRHDDVDLVGGRVELRRRFASTLA
jgi:hypothetical protein